MSTRASRFTLDWDNRRLLGVCAGLASYMEAPVTLIRIIFALACFVWPVLIIVYFVTYWWLKKDLHTDTVRNYLSSTRTAEHFRKVDYHKRLYRNTRNKRIAGVCSGIADYLEIRTKIVRILAILSFFIFGPFSFFAYCVCWMVLERQPLDHIGYNELRSPRRRSRRRDARNTEFNRPVENRAEESITMSIKQCSAAFNAIEARLRHAEAFITSKKFRLHCELNRI